MFKLSFLIFFFFLIIENFGQNNIIGNWTGYCVIESTDTASIAFCDFCPIDLSEDKTRITFNKFDIVFDDKIVNFITDNDTTKTNYHFNENIETIEFKLNEKDYTFKILTVMGATSGKKLIMKDSDDMLILLEKKE